MYCLVFTSYVHCEINKLCQGYRYKSQEPTKYSLTVLSVILDIFNASFAFAHYSLTQHFSRNVRVLCLPEASVNLPTFHPLPSPTHTPLITRGRTRQQVIAIAGSPRLVSGRIEEAARPVTCPRDWRSEAPLKPGARRTRQRCSGPVCDRPSASRPVPSSQNRPQRRRWMRFRRDGTGRDALGRSQTGPEQR